jgi:hypothetical protein
MADVDRDTDGRGPPRAPDLLAAEEIHRRPPERAQCRGAGGETLLALFGPEQYVQDLVLAELDASGCSQRSSLLRLLQGGLE